MILNAPSIFNYVVGMLASRQVWNGLANMADRYAIKKTYDLFDTPWTACR